jgi:tRNA1(Val) A37 N6-methylase TrmN6
MNLLSKYKFAASRLQMVEGHPGERPALFLLEAVLHSRRELIFEPNFTLHLADGRMSPALSKIYQKGAEE